jgi:hypothetical protein
MSKWIRLLVLYPALIFGGCHFLMTGSPVPLWHIEELDSPVPVRSVTDRHLVLADGRTVPLPFIESVPHDDPLFRAALADGVEVNRDGEIYGLMWADRLCGNDPVAWRKVRVNLSDLAGALDPEGIDDSIVPPDAIAHLAEHKRLDPAASSHRRGRLNGLDLITLRATRSEFESAASRRPARAER